MAVNEQTVRLMDEARNELALTINSAVTPIQQRYITIANEASEELRRVLAREAAETAAGTLSLETMRQRDRIISVINSTRTQLDSVGLAARSTLLNTATNEVIPLGVNYDQLMIGSQIGPGYAQMASRVLPSTVEEIARRAAQRSIYLADVGAETAARVESALTRGILVGDNPRRVGQRLAAEVGGILQSAGHSATRIMRTEMLDTYRNADIAVRETNGDVLKGWRWHSAGDFNTCASCWAMHGEMFPIDEPGPDDHPNGRCTAIPVVRDDLALEGVPQPPSRDELWSRLSPAEQRGAIGPTRVQLLKEGTPWSAFSKVMPEPLGWRQFRVATPLSELPLPKVPVKSSSAVKATAAKKATKKATATAPVKKAPAKKATAPATPPTPPVQPIAPTVDPSSLRDFATKVPLPDGRQALRAYGMNAEQSNAASKWTTSLGNRTLQKEAKEAFAAKGYRSGKQATSELASAATGATVESVGEAVAHWVKIGNENIQSLLRSSRLPTKAQNVIQASSPDASVRALVEARLEGRARASIRYLDDGIAGSTSHEGFVGYRGVNGEHIAKHFGEDFLQAAMDGDRRLLGLEFVDDAYTAVSVDSSTAAKFSMTGSAPNRESVIFEIRVPPQKPALSVNGTLGRTGSEFAHEEEFLLGRGTKYRVVEVVGNKEQVYRQAMGAAGDTIPEANRTIIVLEVVG